MHNPVHIKALTPAPARRYDVVGRRLVRSRADTVKSVTPGYRCAMGDPRRALGRLRRAAATGELTALCVRHGVTLLVAFGSTVHGKADPRDLDLAVLAEDLDLIGLIGDLMELGELNEIDLLDLRRAGPLAKERALAHGELLYESWTGLFAQRRDGAVAQFMDTERMRRRQLKSLAR
jgi:predicted nucleotidyltransferase